LSGRKRQKYKETARMPILSGTQPNRTKVSEMTNIKPVRPLATNGINSGTPACESGRGSYVILTSIIWDSYLS
jgi:hypothetical protein